MKKYYLTAAAAIFLTGCGAEDQSDVNENQNNNMSEEEPENNEADNVQEENDEEAEVNDDSSEEEESQAAVIAHRGASGHAPEQTMPALEKAIEMNADWLELDIQMTSDGELVAFHDDEIDRTTDGEGEIGDHTLDELKELDAGSWFNEEYPDQADESFEGVEILTLEEIFEEFGDSENYYIETKSTYLNEDMEEPMVELIEEYGFDESGNIIIQSFHQDSLEEIKELNDSIPLVQLLWWEVDEETGEMEEWLDITPAPDDMTEEDFAEIAEYADGMGLHLEYYDGTEVIDESFVQTARDEGFEVHVYTINEEEDMDRLLDWGVTGLFTDYPDRMQNVLEERE
ncbi:glycerophosphodiester phosphodiesterase family protein [Alkalicoccus saliphilus]|uniref:Glycerophosphodiester phosphodiesterase n=1 Tax=Alkalicoccus saliphilus TaxID=200989 RepID=A0A2T4U665_9BACI|nr:glycerophosphodiester phosphodiesterase family protein [Alkalicoccus saliphilus]PTL38882.1 glycerophosphodiester phosphodiesterase [Alkalicoccus saliphilus]